MKLDALFFDIDGTLVSFDTHTIPASTVAAIERARAAGSRIFISTGRPMAIINNLKPIEHLIDGYITMNGAATIVDGKVIHSFPIAPEDVAKVIDAADRSGVSCVVVGARLIGINNPRPQDIETFRRLIGIADIGAGVDIDKLLKEDVYQLTPFVTAEEEAEFSADFDNVEVARWCPLFCDVTAKGVDKGRGVEALCAHFGIPVKNTAAFGDGGNDIAMLRAAGIGVAMGNANPEVKEMADYITTSVDDNGIANALTYLEAL